MKKKEAKEVVRGLKWHAAEAAAMAKCLEHVAGELEHRVTGRGVPRSLYDGHEPEEVLGTLDDFLEGMRETLILLQDDYEKLDYYFTKKAIERLPGWDKKSLDFHR